MRSSEPHLLVRRLCQMLQGNQHCYSASRSSQQQDRDETALRDAIEQLIVDFPGYGYRPVTAALKHEGWKVNHKRVLRIMREESLLCQLKRRFAPTTDSQHGYQVYPNLVKDLLVDALDVVWVADITSIRLPTTFVSLAAILDAYSRKCVGFKLSKRH